MADIENRNYNKNKDAILETVVNIINNLKAENDSEMNIGVTLLVNGKILSGEIISTNKYMELQARSFEKCNGNNEIRKAFSDGFSNMKNALDVNKDIIEECNFIHLDNVSIINENNNKLSINGTFRIKLSDVSGFMFGQCE
ncbi:hypothetical protein EXQ41_06820 [Clostridium botulinum]|nr:gas vesicle accessory protein GvpU [Clostridium botulinum]MBO0555762.1 hypothetical protein [Clostridium botulinum]